VPGPATVDGPGVKGGTRERIVVVVGGAPAVVVGTAAVVGVGAAVLVVVASGSVVVVGHHREGAGRRRGGRGGRIGGPVGRGVLGAGADDRAAAKSGEEADGGESLAEALPAHAWNFDSEPGRTL